MNLRNYYRMLILAGMIGLFGCGGGGGSTTSVTPPPAAKTTTTISGTVSFPSISSLVAKQSPSIVSDAGVSVQAYTLEGTAVGVPVTPTYDNSVTGSATDFTLRVYSYALPDIPIGKDYVIKAKRIEGANKQELKKLIEKTDVVETPVLDQNLHSVSTAAVVVASQKLTTSMGITGKISLGDLLPSLGSKTVTNLSDAIVTDVAPKSLETSIQNAKTTVSNALATGNLGTALAAMTAEDKKALADLVNMLNIVVAAVANNADPTQILAGTSSVNLSAAPTAPQLKLLSVDTGGTIGQASTATTTISQTVIQDTVTSVDTTYFPPRVKIEFSTDSTTLHGIIIDVTIPADAKVRADSTGKLDTMHLSVPVGAVVDAQYNSTTRKIRFSIASGSSSLSAKFITLNFERTLGKTLTSTDFPHAVIETSDISGNSMSTSFNLTKVVTTSGS